MHGMGRLLTPLKVVVALLLMIVPVIGQMAPVGAQAGDTYASNVSDEEASWSADWELAGDPLETETIDRISLASDNGLAFVTWISGDSDAGEIALLVNQSIITDVEYTDIDAATSGEQGFAIGSISGEDLQASAFTFTDVFDGYSRSVTVLNGAEVIGETVALAQETIEVEGDPVFGAVESVTADAVVLAESSGTDDADTPESTEEDEAPTEESDVPSGDNTYTIELSGAELAWTDDWAIEESLITADVDFESVGFVNGAWVQSILFLPSGIDLDAARDSFLEGFAGDDVAIQVVDRGAYDNVSYSLDLAEIDGTLFGLFTVYIDDGEFVRSYATLALQPQLGDGVDAAAADITIDGEPIYNGVTGSGLQDLLDMAADDFTPTDTVTVDDDEPTEEATEEDEPTEEATEEDDPTEEATEEDEDPTEEATEEDEANAGDGDLEALGLVGAREYESPQWGTTTEWSRDFELAAGEDGPGVTSDTDGGLDSLALAWTDSEDALSSLSITYGESTGQDLADLEAYYLSDEFAGLFAGETGEVVGSDSTDTAVGVLIATDAGLLFYAGAIEVDGGDTLVTYLAIIDPAEGAAFQEAVVDGIEVDGEPIMDLIEVE